MLPVIKMGVNSRGGLYVNGSKLPPMFHERVLDLYHETRRKFRLSDSGNSSRTVIESVEINAV